VDYSDMGPRDGFGELNWRAMFLICRLGMYA
jgi:hypothetical protein